MDTFDIRKYITENKINDQEGYERRYLITFADGTDEEVGKHGSVSPEDIIGSLKKKYARQGKKVSDVKYLGEKPQGIYESDMGDAVEFYMNHYDENEMPQEIRDAISDALDSGKPLKWVKDQIKDGFLDMILPEGKVQDRIDSLVSYYEAETGNVASEDVEYEIEYMVTRGKFDDQIKANVLKEDKDVIEPDKDAVAAEVETEEEEEDYFDRENAEKIKPQAEQIIANSIVDAYGREDGKRPQTSKRLVLSIIRDFKQKDPEDYLATFDGEDPRDAASSVLTLAFAEYLDTKVDSGNITDASQAEDFATDLADIFYMLISKDKTLKGLRNYIKNVSSK